MTADPFAAYRPVLDAALTRAVDSLATSHVVLLTHKLEDGECRQPGLVCLLAADALGAPAGAAEPAAVALSLLDAMGATFADLDDADAPLSRYGMPRSLNAGDGFYALAQAALLHAADPDDAEQRLAAVDMLDATSRAYAEDLRLGGDGTSLTDAAVQFAALAAGVSMASLPAAARAKIDAALQFLK